MKTKTAMISDFDGTLRIYDKKTPYFRKGDLETIREFRKRGGLFAICTGRPYRWLKRDSDPGLETDFVIATSGACVTDSEGNTLAESTIREETVGRLLKEFGDLRVMVQNAGYICVQQDIGVPSDTAVLIHGTDGLIKDHINGVSIAAGSQERAAEVTEKINRNYPDVTAFHNVRDVDIVPKGTSKGTGVQQAKQIFGIALAGGIGDSYNDIPLLDAADVSFTFHTSPDEVKAHADYIVSDAAEAIGILENIQENRMNTQEKLKKYEDWLFRVSAYRMALAIVGIDKQTVAPSAGASYRDKRSAYLAGELFSIETEPEMVEILKELSQDETLDGDTLKAVRTYYKETMKTVCIPKDVFVEAQELYMESWNAWLEGKTKSDYSIFEPYLRRVIEMKKKLYAYRESDLELYDQMLDDYEPGMTREKYDAFFGALKERLVPLIRRVTEAEQIDDSFLRQEYDVDEQKKFMKELLAYLHFDKEWGYQNETEHPFTSWTCENDCRTTTKYLKNNVVSAILSTVHEVGHATYEHDVDPKYDGMILSEGISCGMHESQSRLFENYLGKTRAFWEYNYPRLQAHFPEQLSGVTLDQFVRAINAARPSLVRTEADELTYPMHIVVRYEIEKGLFDGSISTEGLDQTWNEMYRKYLGVSAEEAKDGILQDVHWADGSFGYFPTYALGSAFAAQFTQKMREEIDVDEALRNNQYDRCVAWLKENIHRYGARYEAAEVMKMATGREFDVNVYLDYLENKYTELYHLK